MLDPEAVRRRDDLDEVGAVMVVSPFGAPVDTAAWDRFWADTGIPVVIDGAACFDTLHSVAAAAPGRCPIMVSLHATKAYGIGEGGLVLSTDDAIIHRVRQVCNFGIWGSPEGQTLGYNGKLSEYHAAVGLAALDAWPERRRAFAALTERYRCAFAGHESVALVPQYGDGWISSYCNLAVRDNAHVIIDRLNYLGIETRRWWRDGVHLQTAYRKYPHDDLAATNDLAPRVLALPFFCDLSDEQFDRVIASFEHATQTST
jgi:dTDP-4-amino-4,6-dideoxygalactose transaminase